MQNQWEDKPVFMCLLLMRDTPVRYWYWLTYVIATTLMFPVNCSEVKMSLYTQTWRWWTKQDTDLWRW